MLFETTKEILSIENLLNYFIYLQRLIESINKYC